jgi:hypothetical protein
MIKNIDLFPALTDVPVLLMIFVRPKQLTESFNSIKKARPSKLLIVSDGPRKSHPNDKELNDDCKKIVEDIDWECEVFHQYSEINKGMYVTAYNAFKWAFSLVDRLIFLEDDIVPNLSFFKFCEEMLEKHKNDLRIHSICGMNHLGTYQPPQADYFFSKRGSVWGFALWKRTYELFEYDLKFNEGIYHKNLLLNSFPKIDQEIIKKSIELKRNKFLQKGEMADFELVFGASLYLQSGLIIIPKRNLISCHGISENAGHNVNHPLKLPKSIRRLFYMKTYELDFPIKHPKYVITDPNYENLVYKIMGKNNFVRFSRRVESLVRRFFYGVILKK